MKSATMALLLATVIAACANGAAEQPRIVATTNILGDVVANVAGDEAAVEILIPVGADPHEFQASSAQVATMARADLDRVDVFEVAPQLDPIALKGPGDDHGHGFDPHVWMDPLRMAVAAELVGAELSRVDPEGGWVERAAAYAGQLRAAHESIEEVLAPVPADRRVLITNHATMGYFADRYGWEVLRTVVPGGSTTGAPSSGDLAELVALIRAEGVPAIFVDSTRNDDLARAVAAEVGSPVEVVRLHTESLTDGGGDAPTLIDLLTFNAGEISRVMGG